MIFFPRLSKLFIACLSLYLTACAVPETAKNGPSLNVFPVTHSLSLRTEEAKFDQSKQQLETYLDDYSDLLITQSVVMSGSSPASKKLMEFAELRLFAMGVAPNYIQYKEMNADSTSHFDFVIKVVQYQVEDKVCAKSISQNYYLADDGCFTESARWKSMVAPERMLPSLKQAQE